MRCSSYRLLSSSYMTMCLCIMLIVVSFNYWSLSADNSKLIDRIKQAHQQLTRLSQQVNQDQGEPDFLEKELPNIHDRIAKNFNRHDRVAQPRLGGGQLPDVNPASVRVVKKETIGMVFHQDNQGHYLPILPPGNPRMPRGKPEHSVMKMIEQAKEKT